MTACQHQHWKLSTQVVNLNRRRGVSFNRRTGVTLNRFQVVNITGFCSSPCTEKHLSFNTEFTKEPICTASHKYQKLKTAQLQSLNLPAPEYQKQLNEVLEKECLCVGLSNAAALNYNQTFIKTLKAVTICPGPNIANFSEVVSLKTMTDHIYGRANILTNNNRPHMFIAELHLYIDYLKEELENDVRSGNFLKRKKYYTSFYQNLCNGITYYRNLPDLSGTTNQHQFIKGLHNVTLEMDVLNYRYAII